MNHRHRSCGSNPGPRGRDCLHCELVEAYTDRREMYLDAEEQRGAGDEPVKPVVTFRWWLANNGWDAVGAGEAA